jgi:hypothetical protein
VDLDRMLRMCRAGQWSPSDLDWSQTPRPMSEDDERAIVQLFTDMAVIERLAGALFVEQEKRVTDPRLKAIFATFVGDEVRHSQVAQMLADHYDRRHLQIYRPSEHLSRFFGPFVDTIHLVSDDVANAYITAGELILDVALLRSIDDYVGDPMSAQAMELINKDESRHIAIDYHMAEQYASDAYFESRSAPSSLGARARACASFVRILFHARPFFRDVFFAPMERIDPSGTRLREAMKRIQLLTAKPGLQRLPFVRFMRAVQDLHNSRVAGPRVREVLARVAGAEPRFLERLNTEAELERAARMSFDALADEALAVKYER